MPYHLPSEKVDERKKLLVRIEINKKETNHLKRAESKQLTKKIAKIHKLAVSKPLEFEKIILSSEENPLLT